MSIIADALKKNKRKENGNSYVSVKKFSFYSIGFYVILLIFFIIVAGFVLDFLKFRRQVNTSVNFNINTYSRTLNLTINKYKKNISKNQLKNNLNYLLVSNRLEKLKNKLNEIKKKHPSIYLKYYAILNYKQKNYQRAFNLFNNYLKRNKNDYEALSYIADIYFLQKDYADALTELNKIKKDNFELLYNKAVVYETIGDYNSALRYYKKSCRLTNDLVIKKRILNKIFLMENYE